MLSIRLDAEREWWTPGSVFERLFLSALAHGRVSGALEEWRHIADANGGFSLADADPAVAHELVTGLRAEARAEIERIAVNGACDADDSYRVSLVKFLGLFRDG